MRAITDKDVTVEHAALATLAEIGPSAEEAVPAVMAVLSDINQDQDCRSQAACTLGRISSGTSDVITTLQRTLKDESPCVRCCFAMALGRFGTAARQAIPDIKRLLEGEKRAYVRRELMQALQAIEDGAKEPRNSHDR